MLIDVPLGDPVTETGALIDHVMEIGDLATLRERRGEFPGALMDRTLRELLGV